MAATNYMNFNSFYRSYIADLFLCLANAKVTDGNGADIPFDDACEKMIERFTSVHEAGGKTIILGNGGSAAIASHQSFDRWKNGDWRTMSFNDTSLLTGGGNDFGYADVFTKPLAMFATKIDVVIAISSSGKSANIVNAAKKAKEMGCFVITMSAFGPVNPLRSIGDINVYLDTGEWKDSYGLAELGHETILHAMLDYHIARRRGASVMFMRDRRSKIVTPDELAEVVRRTKDDGKKVVHCHGVFDLVHTGHINYFEQSRKFGDLVYVSILADRFVRKGPGRPRFPEQMRLDWVAALECVDYVVLNHEEGPWSLMRTVRPDIYTKGESERPKLENPDSGLSMDKRVMEEVGGELRFTPEIEVHSTDLLKAFGVEK